MGPSGREKEGTWATVKELESKTAGIIANSPLYVCRLLPMHSGFDDRYSFELERFHIGNPWTDIIRLY